jgi:hypothetical protein
LEKFWDDIEADTLQIQRENQQMAVGMPLDINSYDNDQQHIAGHTDFQKSSSYQSLPPPAKQNMENHVAAHRERLLESMGPPPGQPVTGPPGANGPPQDSGQPPGDKGPPGMALPPSAPAVPSNSRGPG